MDINRKIINPSKEKTKQEKKKDAKAYEKYAKQFTAKPKYVSNCIKAFIVGGIICEIGYFIQSLLMNSGMDKETAGSWVTIILICLAQLLTGFGVYDTIGKFAGAGSAVPITGFANSVVAPAMDYKKEGIILGVGSKIFSLAGPVIACGTLASVVIGLIYYFIGGSV